MPTPGKAENERRTGHPPPADPGDASRQELDRHFLLVYQELRRMAHARLRGEREGHTLDTTGLVHEAYLRLADRAPSACRDRAHFFALAVHAMRRVLVDYGRRHRALKRGGGRLPSLLDEQLATLEDRAELLLAVDEALDRLSALSERLGRVVECRYFAGLSEEETAEVLGVTPRTVRRDWIKAKGWLYQELKE